MREAVIERKTAETDIKLRIDLDGKGESSIDTGIGFLDHMLTLFARHSGFDIDVKCQGDTYVDFHHSAEDIGICLGQAFKDALGDKRGIRRYGECMLPMDEALVLTALDISGRSWIEYDLAFGTEKIGDFDTELIREFWVAFAMNSCITLHIRKLSGINSHHIAEASFKSVARSLRNAVSIDPDMADRIPSTKGTLA